MAALRTRKGIPRIIVPEQLRIPRPIIRAGLLCRPACREVKAVVQVGKTAAWVTRWLTAGIELPYGQDWLFFLAIMTCYVKAPPSYLLVFQSVAEVHRLASQLGAGTTGGAMTRLASASMRRLCQASFGWQETSVDLSALVCAQISTEPLVVISSGIAQALWGDSAWPIGIQVEDDDRLWIRPSTFQLVMLRDVPFHIPRDVVRTMAGRMDHLSIGLAIAAYAQATQAGIPIGRRTLETLATRITGCPITRVARRVDEATAQLLAACSAAGFTDALTARFTTNASAAREKSHTGSPGRPRQRWSLFVWPARPPFARH